MLHQAGQDTGTRYWHKILAQDTGTRYWGKILAHLGKLIYFEEESVKQAR